jgi:hypothetical protein
MEQYQIEQIKNCFKRCYGLQEIAKDIVNKIAVKSTIKDVAMEISAQTCIRQSLIIENFEQIANL